MIRFLTFSYAGLWLLVSLEALILQHVLRETVWVRRFYTTFRQRYQRDGLAQGSALPSFRATVLASGETVTERSLQGESILLFVSSDDTATPSEAMRASLHGMWHKAEGRLYVVCQGRAAACRQLVEEALPRHAVPVIHDEDGALKRTFQIVRTPAALELDENMKVGRYGMLFTPEELEAHRAARERTEAHAPAQARSES